MKQIMKYILLIILILFIIFGYGCYYYYSPPTERKPYPITKNHSDTLRIAYIGDSWAFIHAPYDDRMTESLSHAIGRPAKVKSMGGCGLTSKEIYWRLFDDTEMKTFISNGYDYCIISAGINDSNKKMSTYYYKQSMECIINFMLFNNITPIIIEIPDYDIEKMYRWQMPSRKLLKKFSQIVTGTPINCKRDFRQALDELLKEKDYNNKVHVIKYKTWNSNYAKDQNVLYESDGVHLNKKGYTKLDSCIVDRCVQSLKRKKNKRIG